MAVVGEVVTARGAAATVAVAGDVHREVFLAVVRVAVEVPPVVIQIVAAAFRVGVRAEVEAPPVVIQIVAAAFRVGVQAIEAAGSPVDIQIAAAAFRVGARASGATGSLAEIRVEGAVPWVVPEDSDRVAVRIAATAKGKSDEAEVDRHTQIRARLFEAVVGIHSGEAAVATPLAKGTGPPRGAGTPTRPNDAMADQAIILRSHRADPHTAQPGALAGVHAVLDLWADTAVASGIAAAEVTVE